MINLGVDETMLHFSNEFELKLKKKSLQKMSIRFIGKL